MSDTNMKDWTEGSIEDNEMEVIGYKGQTPQKINLGKIKEYADTGKRKMKEATLSDIQYVHVQFGSEEADVPYLPFDNRTHWIVKISTFKEIIETFGLAIWFKPEPGETMCDAYATIVVDALGEIDGLRLDNLNDNVRIIFGSDIINAMLFNGDGSFPNFADGRRMIPGGAKVRAHDESGPVYQTTWHLVGDATFEFIPAGTDWSTAPSIPHIVETVDNSSLLGYEDDFPKYHGDRDCKYSTEGGVELYPGDVFCLDNEDNQHIVLSPKIAGRARGSVFHGCITVKETFGDVILRIEPNNTETIAIVGDVTETGGTDAVMLVGGFIYDVEIFLSNNPDMCYAKVKKIKEISR